MSADSIFCSSVAIHIVDNFLGPAVPRFQLGLDEMSVIGEMVNEGIKPRWSKLSKDSVGVVCKFGVQASFFNSIVQAHEPILEPWSLSCTIRKEDSNGYLDCLINGDFLNLNLSTNCLQTLASTSMNILGGRLVYVGSSFLSILN